MTKSYRYKKEEFQIRAIRVELYNEQYHYFCFFIPFSFLLYILRSRDPVSSPSLEWTSVFPPSLLYLLLAPTHPEGSFSDSSFHQQLLLLIHPLPVRLSSVSFPSSCLCYGSYKLKFQFCLHPKGSFLGSFFLQKIFLIFPLSISLSLSCVFFLLPVFVMPFVSKNSPCP